MVHNEYYMSKADITVDSDYQVVLIEFDGAAAVWHKLYSGSQRACINVAAHAAVGAGMVEHFVGSGYQSPSGVWVWECYPVALVVV